MVASLDGGKMNATMVGRLGGDGSDRDAEPRSSRSVSKAELPPPPAQLVAALAAFESSAPDSFRPGSVRPGGDAATGLTIDRDVPGVAGDAASATSNHNNHMRLWVAGFVTVAVVVGQLVWSFAK
jgi:hypothetical protein